MVNAQHDKAAQEVRHCLCREMTKHSALWVKGTVMNYIVLDLEWNQSSKTEETDSRLTFEIIEIGAVRLNDEKRMVGEFSRLIKPQVYHEMHRITSRLIHLKMQELQKGRPFKEVMEAFLAWCGKEEYIFCTWGPTDLHELQSNMKYYDMEPLGAGPIKFLDVQKLFALAFEDEKSRRSLEYAVDFLGIEKDIPFHRAFSDAYYTGKVLAKIPEKICEYCSYDVFTPPKNKEEEVKVVFPTYAKYISRVFSSKEAALADREVTSCKCYLCRSNIKRKIRWFTTNGKHYYCVGNCSVHGFMKGKIRIRKAGSKAVYIVKTTKLVSEEEAEAVRERKEHAREQRRKRRHRGSNEKA